jgi:UDP-N-acetylmuramyl pentapeptide phosphotransferase/UDP-N-acetylglucosamine-1-phosphate transferase
MGRWGCFFDRGYTNAFNFMDGINGMAAGQATVTGVAMAVIGAQATGDFLAPPVIASLTVASAALGFLPHNFPRARMFMGDVGSAPLGFLLAVLVIWLAKSIGWWSVIPLMLLHANFVLDTAATLVRRMIRGERWYQAHREHFYQRLIRSGKSHYLSPVSKWCCRSSSVLMLCYQPATHLVRLVLALAVVVIWFAFFITASVVLWHRLPFKSLTEGDPGSRLNIGAFLSG